MTTPTTLAPRGASLASAPSNRTLSESVEADLYHPTTNPTGFINIGTAENYIMQPTIAAFTAAHPISLSARNFSYGEGAWATKRLRQGMAAHMNRALRPVVEIGERDLLMANGVAGVCEMLGFTLAEAGDGILMGRPIYQAFPIDFGTRAKVEAVHVSFGDVDQFSPEAAACYERALVQAEQHDGMKVRALLLCHPHNPLGLCYPQATIIALMQLCTKYKIHLISDEIYAMSVYNVPDSTADGAIPFSSTLAFDSSDYIDPAYLHVMYGMSKDFAAGGLRVGCLYTRNEELWRALSGMSVFSMSSVAGDLVATAVLEDEGWLASFFATSRQRLSERNQLARTLLDAKGVPYRRGANAGFFIWAEFRRFLAGTGKEGWEAEGLLVERMMERKVYVTDGKSFGAEEPGWFRVIFSQEEDVMREGLRRVFEAVGA
ncbi:hypothetical protein LTR85_007341 [Meristemomyces frigidus]|nr:hypothetical protein LTR85_007341 [Meristemomyces frigidus]